MNDSNRLKTPIPSAYLVPVFVTEQEEAYLLSKIEELGGTPIDEDGGGADDDAATKVNGNQGGSEAGPSTRRFKSKPTGWKDVKGRRSMYWGGSVLSKSNALVPLPLPAFMQDQFPNIVNRVQETGAFAGSKQGKPNHVLVNEYLPGQGIFPHQDGPAYYPTVATLSLGSHTILDIFAYTDESAGMRQDDGASGSPRDIQDNGTRARSYNSTPILSILLPRRSLFILTDDLYKGHLHGIAERKADTMEDLKRCINWDDISSRRSRWEMGEEEDKVQEWPRSRRVSLTMRSVEKVLKNLFARP